jgi:hypothetical protein
MRIARHTIRTVVLTAAALASALPAGCNARGKAAPSDEPVALAPREPAAVAARAARVRRDADALRADCRRAAGGDWDKWQRQTAIYRAALRARLEALQVFKPARSPLPEAQYEALEGRDGFPLFELGGRLHLNYLYDNEQLDPFRKDRPVVAVRRWLARRGIDLIFVPVPKMTEVYVEHFLKPCPPDGVIAPAIRRCLLDLLDDDVEAVDGFTLFRSKREAEYLYLAADSHWGPVGMRLMAREVAGRIARYEFGAMTRHAPPVVRCDPRAGKPPGKNGWPALSEAQRQRAAAAVLDFPTITMPDGRDVPDDSGSPVLLIGNSYVRHFREVLVQELNLLVHSDWSPGQTTEAFADFVREPDLLDGCRVVVWITTCQHLTHFQALPAEIAREMH